MTKGKHSDDYTVEGDGSVTFPSGDVSEETRAKAYEEAARQRAAATHVDPDELIPIARESADLVVEREHATEVEK